MNRDGSDSLQERYIRELAEVGSSADAAQRAALEELAQLRGRLLASSPAEASLPRLLRQLAGRPRWPPERGLYLCGSVGRGKTWLMDLFFDSLPFAERRRRHFHRFMLEVHLALKTLGEHASPLEEVAESIARETRVLCLDELAVADIADAMLLGGLFAGLFRRGVTLVATSNVRPDDLYRDGLQRERFLPAIDLIKRHTRLVLVEGPVDYRLRQLTAAGTYLSAGASDTAGRLAALFGELSGHAAATDAPLEIEGRLIPVVRRAGPAVWFEFDVLCGTARSQNDYIEIAREYRFVILANVPVLDGTREDEARRFIALVDEFYDRNVALILSAQSPPAQLYSGERLQMEFRRTASRLSEMQSAEYLAREHRP